jgi:2-iminobutanoate/2-iminopropanoate deaminase
MNVSKRRSIEVAGVKHTNPIPAGARIGPFVATGSIFGKDPQTGEFVEGIDAQCELMFENIRRLIDAAGGTTDDILKLEFWITDVKHRANINKQWLAMFPDPEARPARHTFIDPDLSSGALVQCSFFAVIGEN